MSYRGCSSGQPGHPHLQLVLHGQHENPRHHSQVVKIITALKLPNIIKYIFKVTFCKYIMGGLDVYRHQHFFGPKLNILARGQINYLFFFAQGQIG